MPLKRCVKCGSDSPSDGWKNCSKCHGATGVYCSKECQVAHWKTHKPICRPLKPDEVWGIKLLDNSHGPWPRQFEHVLLTTSHPIFTVGDLCPVTAKCGFPLLIYSTGVHNKIRCEHDNQPAVYLRIEPYDGFAPMNWQAYWSGTCYVVRQDREPLTKEALEIVYQFHSYLLDNVDDELLNAGQGAWRRELTPEWLRSFADEYRKEERENGRIGFDFFP